MPNLNSIMLVVLTLCYSGPADAEEFRLVAPTNWGGETITLPPAFAKDMAVKGVVRPPSSEESDDSGVAAVEYVGRLEWGEPLATKKIAAVECRDSYMVKRR